jgi:hypothetical protein
MFFDFLNLLWQRGFFDLPAQTNDGFKVYMLFLPSLFGQILQLTLSGCCYFIRSLMPISTSFLSFLEPERAFLYLGYWPN